MPGAAFHGPLNSNCSNVECYVSDLQVCQTRLCHKNTVCNLLISLGLVMLHIPRIQFKEVIITQVKGFATSIICGIDWVCKFSQYSK